MIGILLFVVAVIIIAVLIVINTKALAAKSRGNNLAEEELQSDVSVSEEQVQEFMLKEDSEAIQEIGIPKKDTNAMDDQEFRDALKKFNAAMPPTTDTTTHSMKDDDYRNALKSMNDKRDK